MHPDRDDVETRNGKKQRCYSKGRDGVEAIKQAAERGADNQRRLHHRGRGCDRLLQHRGRHDIRQQRRHGRALEGDDGAEHRDGGEDAGRRQPLLPGGDRQHQRRHRLDQLADKPDAPPVEPVGDMADDEGQHRHRQELAEADEAERKGAVRLVVDHPSHGDANGLEGERGKNAGGSEVQIAGVAKNAPRSLGYVHCDVTGRLRSRQPL